MFEKRFAAVAPQLLTSDGTVNGQIKVANASLYKVKQIISLQNASVGPKQFQVQRITDINTIFLGPLGSSNIVNDRSDVSAYTVALGSFIVANEQPRTTVPEEQVERWTYEEEPVVARRVILVDPIGNKIGPSNPLPVQPGGESIAPNSFGDVTVAYDSNSNPIQYNFYLATVLQGYIVVTYDSNSNPINYQGYDASGHPL
jgi:hypothetical protein